MKVLRFLLPGLGSRYHSSNVALGGMVFFSLRAVIIKDAKLRSFTLRIALLSSLTVVRPASRADAMEKTTIVIKVRKTSESKVEWKQGDIISHRNDAED